MRFYREFVRTVPDELTTLVNLMTAPPAPFLPEEWHGKKLVGLVGCYSGDPEEGMKALQPIRELGDPVADLVGPMPYVQMQSLLDALWPKGTSAYMKAGYLARARRPRDRDGGPLPPGRDLTGLGDPPPPLRRRDRPCRRRGDRLRRASGAVRAQHIAVDPRTGRHSTPTSTGRSGSTPTSSRR